MPEAALFGVAQAVAVPGKPHKAKRGIWLKQALPRPARPPSEVPLEVPGEAQSDVRGAVVQLLPELLTAGGADTPQGSRAALDAGPGDILVAVLGDELHGHLGVAESQAGLAGHRLAAPLPVQTKPTLAGLPSTLMGAGKMLILPPT